MTQVAKAMERLRPWLPLREDAAFSGAFDAIYSGAHADIVTLWQDAAFREQKFEEQKQSLDEEWGAQPESSPANYWRKRAQEAERDRDEAQMERSDALKELTQARTAPAVTHADVEKALRASTNDVFQDESYPHMADAICDLLGIEAEQAVDPVEEAAVAAFKAAWHRADEEGDEGNRVRRGIRAARRVLGQEASSDE